MYNVDIKKLKISYKQNTLVDLSFGISTSTALVGQSGSGKSLTLKALLNLLSSNLSVQKDIKADFELGYDTIGFIPQNPFTSLSPMTKIKNQFFCSEEMKKKSLELVDLPKDVLDKYANQLSGGQIQRVVIAIALSKDTKLLLLDEPTTALDEKNKANIIQLIDKLREELGILTLFVTHDISSIKDICENIVIIKDGKIVEVGLTKDILENPKENYTKILLNSTFENKEFRT